MGKNTTVYERYKTEIYRIGWRVQYRAKKIRNRECPNFDYDPVGGDFTTSSEEKILVQQLIDSLPPQGKTLIDKLYFQCQTEAEIAQHFQISQQAVNKWKRKMIQTLSQIMKY